MASAKAIRMLRECRVMPAGAAAVFEVRGDHGRYHTVIGDGFAFCDCPHRSEFVACSHIESATLLHTAMVAEGDVLSLVLDDGETLTLDRRELGRCSRSRGRVMAAAIDVPDLPAVDGFFVPSRPLPAPTVPVSDAEREAILPVLAAMLCGLTPEDAAAAIESGAWPDRVTGLLAMPWEPEELSAWVDVLMAVRESAAAGIEG